MKVWFLSPEDVIVSKLRRAREKDTDDIRNVMTVQHDRLDWAYTESWCTRHDTSGLMEQVRRSVPDV